LPIDSNVSSPLAGYSSPSSSHSASTDVKCDGVRHDSDSDDVGDVDADGDSVGDDSPTITVVPTPSPMMTGLSAVAKAGSVVGAAALCGL